MSSPEQTPTIPTEIRGLNARRPVSDRGEGLADALDHIRKYRSQYRYHKRRTKEDELQRRSSLGLTLVSTGMIHDARQLSEAMREITNAELEQGLEYVISASPVEVAVRGLTFAAKGTRLVVTVGGEEVKDEMAAARDFIASLIPDSDSRAVWLKKYKNRFPHVSLGTFDTAVPPSVKMLDEVKEKLPANISLDPTKINYDRRPLKPEDMDDD